VSGAGSDRRLKHVTDPLDPTDLEAPPPPDVPVYAGKLRTALPAGAAG
jgi:hypothetical protein